jgi:phosphoglycerate kinase
VKNIEDAEVEGRKVLLRTDLNLPVEDGRPRKTVRFRRYLETIRELSERGAKTMLVAHQGRPARDDFLSLEQHSEILSDSLDQDVDFVESFFGSGPEEAVDSMEKGDVCMLENIRFLSEELQNAPPEDHADDFFVQELAGHFDLYVDDGFSAAHRSHGSLVGFPEVMESYAGPVMQRELENCSKVRDRFDEGLLVLGGEKPSDIIGMLEEMIESVDKVLLGGVPGELALKITGKDIGQKEEWIEEHEFNVKASELEEMLEDYSDKIVVPEDLRTDSGNHEVGGVPEGEMIWDIGKDTQEKYVEAIREAEAVVMKGPMGAFDQGHEKGSKAVVDALANEEAYTVIGGGHTSSLVQRFDHELEDFSHVSIAGGAFVRFMSGEKLAAVEALR